MPVTVLIIDDEVKLAGLISRIIELEGYKTIQAHTAKEGLARLADREVQVVLSDVKLPDANGVALVKDIKVKFPWVEVICLTAYGTISDGVLAIKNGAFDYITKGDDNDRIIPLLSKAAAKAEVQYKLHKIESRLIDEHGFDTIIGESAAIKQAINMARRVAATETTVLLLGETGTGKEVFAQAIHYNSARRHNHFVAVNCSAFARDLLESEVFGYKAGAFTGANKDKKGLLEEADGGTLFLDEIGEMNIDLQAKLLRVLESGEFIKVGETRPQKVNVRIIAATNRNLEDEIEQGHFRQDLFYRLSVFSIQLPSLNERVEDIDLLANHFLKYYAGKANSRVLSITPGMLNKLQHHRWKGNIRELKNVIERAVILADSEELTAEDLPFNDQGIYAGVAYEMAEVEKRHIQWMLHHTKGNKTEAARLMKIGLTTLYRKMEEFGI